ncbi:hypothetical protein PSm6_21230 [Pseudomonas solani]|uniref:Cbb3-type cytochrome oxidase assembly protein CcoS n=1 Tax=Pseudomonas solani TaxID=2731552 RepID=A0AAU7Y1W5_9PSED|nr:MULTISPECIES: hypothetical protein [Pseudomonas]EQM69739.1 hypothetical protein L682_11720 [Pseudomonas alcaligenes OT 69]MBB4818009.1 hypothetical protein [Pseudomonas alcaligenes]MDN4143493.1 hypothetical protein [Pseudomonas tohonis]MDU9411274.1 hypothetical protein [Pseudomonas sp. zfem005]WCD80545.1 hypothetical protein PI990_00605 [Pseudomonas sp. TUM22785]
MWTIALFLTALLILPVLMLGSALAVGQALQDSNDFSDIDFINPPADEALASQPAQHDPAWSPAH